MAADRMTIAKPGLEPDEDDDEREGVDAAGVWTQATGFWPSAVQIALSRPYWGWPGGRHAYTKRQMTDAPTSEMASGRKMNVLATRLVLHAVDEPGDEQAQPDRSEGADDQPDDVVPEDREHRAVGQREPVVLEDATALGDAQRAPWRSPGRSGRW